MDGVLGSLYDLQYLSGEGFQDKEDRVKDWMGEVLTESKLRKILIPLEAGNLRQIEAMKKLQFLYDCGKYGEPTYELAILNL